MSSSSSDVGRRLPSGLQLPPCNAVEPLIVPVGINFGPTAIDTAFFITGSQFYTGTTCGDSYRTFFKDVLSNEVLCNLNHSPNKCLNIPTALPVEYPKRVKDTIHTFSRHIMDAVGMGISALDRHPALKHKLFAVTVPDHWGEFPRTLVAYAAKIAGHPLDGSHMIIPLSRAVQLNYAMNNENEPKTTYSTLILLYHKSYLHLMLVEMCGTDCITKRQMYYPQLGENDLHKVDGPSSMIGLDQESSRRSPIMDQPSDDDQDKDDCADAICSGEYAIDDISKSSSILSIGDVPELSLANSEDPTSESSISEHSTSETSSINGGENDSLDRGTTIPDEFNANRPICHNQAVHFKSILNAISSFMIQPHAPETSTPATEPQILEDTPDTLRNAVRDIKYIVIDGEASNQGQRDLRRLVRKLFINEDWIQVLDHRYDCGGYGVAVVANQQFQNPKRLGDWNDLPSYESGKFLE